MVYRISARMYFPQKGSHTDALFVSNVKAMLPPMLTVAAAAVAETNDVVDSTDTVAVCVCAAFNPREVLIAGYRECQFTAFKKKSASHCFSKRKRRSNDFY